MIKGQELLNAIYSITDEKKIEKELIFEGIKEGFQKAYEKFFDPEAIIKVEIDENDGNIKVFKELTVVEEVEDEWLEITLDDAKEKYGQDVNVGLIVYEPVVFDEKFSRLAIMHVGQIIKQKIREGEKQIIYEKFADKEKTIVYGEVKDITETSYLVSVDGYIIPIWNKKMIPGENYNIGQRISFFIESISKDDKHSQVQGTRVHPLFLKALLEQEVPEIREGYVEVKAVSREPGRRAKVAVISNDPTIDPIGACVGSAGSRIKNITSQLNGERIDVILWNDDRKQFVINAMMPVRVISIEVDEENGECTIVVPNEQLSLAIGKKGMGSRLVANVVGFKINIFSLDNANEDGIDILWNGNITEEELNSKEFLENTNKRKQFAHQKSLNINNQKQDDYIEEQIKLSDSSIDEIKQNLSAFEKLEDDNETSDFNVDELDDYDQYYE